MYVDAGAPFIVRMRDKIQRARRVQHSMRVIAVVLAGPNGMLGGLRRIGREVTLETSLREPNGLSDLIFAATSLSQVIRRGVE